MSNGYEESQTVLLGKIASHGLLNGIAYDEVYFTPSSNQPTSITYKSGGVTVATLNFTYNGSDITSITRT